MTDILVLNEDFELTAVIDIYQSLVWTDRYFEAGDFEFSSSNHEGNASLLTGKYIAIGKSDRTMVIENIQLNTESSSSVLTVKGRSLESILDRRVIVSAQNYESMVVQSIVEDLLTRNIIDPEDPNRKISNFVFDYNDDEGLSGILVTTQFGNQTLYAAIVSLCNACGLGWSLTFVDGNFSFRIYKGVDRSWNQELVPYILFSPDQDNLIRSAYSHNRNEKNAAYVGGEKGVGNFQTVVEVNKGVTGLDRREVFLDAQDISRVDDEGNEITLEEYIDQLSQRGVEELEKRVPVAVFETEVDAKVYEYGVDFGLGDIVQVINEYGLEGRSRLIDITFINNEEGSSLLPLFVNV